MLWGKKEIKSMQLKQNLQCHLGLYPKMHKQLTILQMPTYELKILIEKALEENPLLEEIPSQTQEPLLDEIAFKPSSTFELFLETSLCFVDPQQKKIASVLLEEIDNRGLFLLNFEQLLEKYSLETNELSFIINTLQETIPWGIFCFNQKSSFLIQAKALKFPKYFLDILESSYSLLEKGQFSKLKKKHPDVCLKTVQNFCHKLSLNPLENRKDFLNLHTSPEFYLEKNEIYWDIIPNNHLPLFKIEEKISDTSRLSKAEKKQLSTWREDAHFLMHAICERKKLLSKILRECVNIQSDFLENLGPLKLLTIQSIGDKLSLHPSTISRAISGKTISTPRGIISIKSLFTSTPTQHTTKSLLKNILNSSKLSNKITDQMLTKILQEKGILIARRTINKYKTQIKKIKV